MNFKLFFNLNNKKMFSLNNNLFIYYFKKHYNSYMGVDLMNYIEEDDIKILRNKRLFKMAPNDWGISLGITNQYIQGSLLKLKYDEVHCDYDGIRKCGFNISTNIYGFDIIFKNNNKFYTVQSKLRQVRGVDPYSCQVNITTSRRRKKRNMAYNKTDIGYNKTDIAYNKTDFDYLFVSLVNIKEDFEYRKDINKWGFAFIPVEKLIDPNNTNYLIKDVPSRLLNEYKITFQDFINKPPDFTNNPSDLTNKPKL